MRSRICPAMLASAAILIIGSPAWAQEAEDAASVPAASTGQLAPRIEGDKQIFEPAQFARFSPKSALDMVRNIPGFVITQASGDRGLGEATQNVLVNGQRISGKSNDAQTVLGRTPVAAVTRLEIVDGATLDIPGLSGQVLNLVTKSTGIQGNFNWQPQWRKRIQNHLTRGEINLSGKLGKGDFTLGLNNMDSFRGGGWGPETVTDGNGNLLYVRDQYGRFYGDRPKLAGSFSLASDGGSLLNVNAELGFFRFRRRQERLLSGPAIPDTAELATGREDEWNMELSGDYEFDLGGGRLKLVGYHRFEHSPVENFFGENFFGASPPTALRFEREADEGETIARAEYGWKSGVADWRVSAEGAFNYLDAKSALFEQDNIGNFQPVDLDNATSRVSEKRGEIILSYGRPLSSSLTFQAQAGGEYSQIEQTGANGLSRQFFRPKGQISLAWKASPRLDVALKIQRKVGQLNFFDFIASVDLQDENNDAGNPDLVPPQSWLAEMELNRSFGATGSAKLKLIYENLTDIVDQIPIGPDGEAPGNLPGSASRWRAEANITLLLDKLGFKGAKLDLEGSYQHSRLTDPVTQLRRAFGFDERWRWEADFRHDIPGSKIAWGLGAEDNSPTPFYRLAYAYREFRDRPQTFAFIEHKDIFGLTLRATLINLIGQREESEEIFFADRLTGMIDERRRGINNYGKILRLSISGTF